MCVHVRVCVYSCVFVCVCVCTCTELCVVVVGGVGVSAPLYTRTGSSCCTCTAVYRARSELSQLLWPDGTTGRPQRGWAIDLSYHPLPQ